MEYIGSIFNDKKLNESKEKIVIFGAGCELIKMLQLLDDMHIKNRIACICDNDSQKNGKEIDGIKIYDLNYTIKHYFDAIYIVYNRFCVEICHQLVERNITKIHLIRS